MEKKVYNKWSAIELAEYKTEWLVFEELKERWGSAFSSTSCRSSSVVPAGVGCCDKAMSVGRDVRWGKIFEIHCMGWGGGWHHTAAVYCRLRDETGWLGLEDGKRKRYTVTLHASLAGMTLYCLTLMSFLRQLLESLVIFNPFQVFIVSLNYHMKSKIYIPVLIFISIGNPQYCSKHISEQHNALIYMFMFSIRMQQFLAELLETVLLPLLLVYVLLRYTPQSRELYCYWHNIPVYLAWQHLLIFSN